jgi:hypothetical protein
LRTVLLYNFAAIDEFGRNDIALLQYGMISIGYPRQVLGSVLVA